MSLIRFTIIGIAAYFGLCTPWLAFAEDESPYYAVVVRIDGPGVAMVRRRAGLETVVGIKQKIYPGDRIMTDSKSVVDLALSDGSLVKVGLNSEFRLEKVAVKDGVLAWVFDLAKGTIRALIEKSPSDKNVKFRVNTPGSSMGVRGTELVLEFSPESGATSLYTLEGSVDFGATGCLEARNCIKVGTGLKATLPKGAGRPAVPVKFLPSDLLKMGDEKAEPKAGDKITASLDRMSLFQDLKKADQAFESSAEVEAFVRKASDAFAAAQDLQLGRTKELRESMYLAMKDGSFAAELKFAEDYDDKLTGKKPVDMRKKEQLYGVIGVKKFALAESILRSERLFPTKPPTESTGIPNANLPTAKVAAGASAPAVASGQAPVPSQAPASSGAGDAIPTVGSLLPKPSARAADQIMPLNERVLDVLAKDSKVVGSYGAWAESLKRVFADDCFLEVCRGDEAPKTDFQPKTVISTTREQGRCYRVENRCQQVYSSCDLSQGKFCKPKTELSCKQTKKTLVVCSTR